MIISTWQVIEGHNTLSLLLGIIHEISCKKSWLYGGYCLGYNLFHTNSHLKYIVFNHCIILLFLFFFGITTMFQISTSKFFDDVQNFWKLSKYCNFRFSIKIIKVTIWPWTCKTQTQFKSFAIECHKMFKILKYNFQKNHEHFFERSVWNCNLLTLQTTEQQ